MVSQWSLVIHMNSAKCDNVVSILRYFKIKCLTIIKTYIYFTYILPSSQSNITFSLDTYLPWKEFSWPLWWTVASQRDQPLHLLRISTQTSKPNWPHSIQGEVAKDRNPDTSFVRLQTASSWSHEFRSYRTRALPRSLENVLAWTLKDPPISSGHGPFLLPWSL